MQTVVTSPNVFELLVQQILDGVGNGVKDVRCIMGWILQNSAAILFSIKTVCLSENTKTEKNHHRKN